MSLKTYGTCQICTKKHRLLKNNTIARHGWKTNSLLKVHAGACEGSNTLPLELDRDALIRHIARVSRVEGVDPQSLLDYVAEKMEIVRDWQPSELLYVAQPETPKAQPKAEPKALPKARPEAEPEAEEETTPSTSEIRELIETDSYQRGDELSAPIVDRRTLKSDAFRLVRKRGGKLKAGDLVLLPAKRVALFNGVTRPEALVPTRVLRVNARGQGIDWVYVGAPLFEGKEDELTRSEIEIYLGVFQ